MIIQKKIQRTQGVILPCIMLFMVCGCLSTSSLDQRRQLRFTTISHIPVIEGRINGKRAYFIIDTGASCSILSMSAAGRFGFKFLVNNNHEVHGLGGPAKLNQAINCIVEIGTLKICNVKFHAKKMDDLTSIIKQKDFIDISGIIGSDIFRRYNINIDYRTNTITF